LKVAFFNPQGNFDAKDSYWTSHPDFGGQLVYVKEVAIAMAKMGVDVDVITRRIEDPDWPEFASEFDRYENIDGVRIIRIKFGGKKFLPKEKLWPYLKDYVKGIKNFYSSEKRMPDFITTHYGDGGISGAMFSSKVRIPYSFTAHSLGAQKMDMLHVTERNFHEMDAKYNFSTRIAAERVAMKYSTFNVVSTSMERFEQYSHKLYKNWINVEDDRKFRVIPPGVNPRIFSAKKRADDRLIEEKLDRILYEYSDRKRLKLPLIVLSSRMDPKKNQISALKAYASDKWLKKNVNFLIVVRGMKNVYEEYKKVKTSEKNVLKELISFIQENELQNKVFFFDANGQYELSSLYRVVSKRNSIFCNVALYEPFGLSIIEAMICGLPVVATKNGGPSEILEESGQNYGVLVEPENIQDISNGFKILLKNKQNYEEYKKLGIERVISDYTWESTAKGYLKAIEEELKVPFEIPKVPEYFISGKSKPKLEL